MVADECFAALVVDSGSEWITTDGDFKRLAGLMARHPFRLSSPSTREIDVEDHLYA
jgi:hypothetical protein